MTDLDLFLVALTTKEESLEPTPVAAVMDIPGEPKSVAAAVNVHPADDRPIQGIVPDEAVFHAEESLFQGWMQASMEKGEFVPQPTRVAITRFPCLNCAKILSNWPKLDRIIAPEPPFSRWYETQHHARLFFEALGIKVIDPLDLPRKSMNPEWPRVVVQMLEELDDVDNP